MPSPRPRQWMSACKFDFVTNLFKNIDLNLFVHYTIYFILSSKPIRVKYYVIFSLNITTVVVDVFVWREPIINVPTAAETRSPPGQKRSANIFSRSDGVDKRLANVVRRNSSVKINREKCSSIKYIWGSSGARVNGGIVIISGSSRQI